MLHLILGDAGSGKTTRLAEEISAALPSGRELYLVVPEQETVSCERFMAEKLPPTAPLTFEVTNFTRFSDTVFRRTGGLAGKIATPAVEQTLVWRTLAELEPYLKTIHSRPDAAAVKKMRTILAELRAARLSPAMMESAAAQVSDEGLSRKLQDYALISSTYSALLSEHFSGNAERLDRLTEVLTEQNPLAGASIYFDSFTSFTEQQYAVFAALLPSCDVTVALCRPPHAEKQLSASDVLNTEKRLTHLAGELGIPLKKECLTGSYRKVSPALTYAAERLFTLDYEDAPACGEKPTDALRLVEAADPLEASDFLAADILKRVTEEGARFGDCTVVTSTSAYTDILDAALDKCGIPYFFARRDSVLSLEPVKMMFAALAIISGGWRREDVIAYLKCSYSGVTPEERDAVDLFSDIWDIRGEDWKKDKVWERNPDGYGKPHSRDRRTYNEAWLKTVREARGKFMPPLLALETVLAKRQTVTEHLRGLTEFLLSLKLPEALDARADACKAAGDARRADATGRVWNTLCDTFDTLSSLVGDTEMNTAEFRELLRLLLGAVSIGQIPAALDEVTVGDAATVRAGGVKHIYLLGVNEGVFPAGLKEGNSFTEHERELLVGLGFPATDGVDLRAARDLFSFYRALTLATESVTVIWCDTDAAFEEALPSDPVKRLRHLIGEDYPVLRPALEKDPSYLRTPSLVRERLGRMTGTALGQAARRALAREGEDMAPLTDYPLTNREATLSPAAAEMQYPGELRLTQSRIKSYGGCPLSDFCNYVLQLNVPERAGFRSDSIGTFVHALLEQFFKTVTETARDPGALDEAEQAEILDAILPSVLAETLSEDARDNPRVRHQIAKLKEVTRLILAEICREFSHTRFRPVYEELRIGDEPEAPKPVSFRTPDGRTLSLWGTIDRVDTYREGSDVYLRVVDYKTGTKEFKLKELEKGADFQLLLYLRTLWLCDSPAFRKSLGVGEDGKVIPAGFLYFSSLARTASVKGQMSASKNAEDILKDAFQRKGMYLDDEVLKNALDTTSEKRYLPSDKDLYTMEDLGRMMETVEATLTEIARDMTGGVIRPKSDFKNEHGNCAYCHFRAVCRLLPTEESDDDD